MPILGSMSRKSASYDRTGGTDRLISGLHFRGRLPHLKREGSTYFVTFRLADSLPAQEIARLKLEREQIIAHAKAACRPLTWHEEQNLLAWYCDRVEELLDRGAGACWLSKPAVAELVEGALRYFDGVRYELRAWVVMPNHVHTVVFPYREHSLSRILHTWKSFTAKEALKIVGSTRHHFWQVESFDHWIRDDEERARMVAYTESNPTKARLCRSPSEWKWSSASHREGQTRQQAPGGAAP